MVTVIERSTVVLAGFWAGTTTVIAGGGVTIPAHSDRTGSRLQDLTLVLFTWPLLAITYLEELRGG